MQSEKNRVRAARGPWSGFVLLAPLVPLALVGLWGAPAQERPATDSIAPSASPASLAPEREHAQILAQSLQMLERAHYSPRALDDAFSETTLERYLGELDPAHMLFLQADVDEARARYGERLDDALKHLDLAPAYDLFARFRERRAAQLDYLIERAATDPAELQLEGDATLERDRREAPRPATEEHARGLWEKLYRNDVLSERLEGRTAAEIQKSLQHRYRGQRDQMARFKSEDVFSLFLNVVTAGFDPHTNYFPPMGAENFDMAMALSFEGIGAVLRPDDEYARIESLIPGGPAERSGELHPTDRIVAVGEGADGPLTDVVGWRLDEVVRLIRGPRGSSVRLRVLSGGAGAAPAKVVLLERDQVELEDQAAKSEVREVVQDGVSYRVGVVTLPTFYSDFEAARKGDEDFRSSTRDVAALIAGLEEEGVDALVLDLRDNGGGALTEAQGVAGLFLGPSPVVQVKNAEGRVQVLGTPVRRAYGGPLVVLVNRLSASASEIVAAALQDRGRAVIVGSRTFGKGTVQGVVSLAEGELKLTEAKFYRISGESTQNLGVQPDVEFPTRYDPTEIGESALPDALPFDRIARVRYRANEPSDEALSVLRERHAERALADPDLAAQRRRLELLRALDERSTISLDEARRRQERKDLEKSLLAIENERRGRLGLEPLNEIDEIDEIGAADDQHADDVDPDLVEAARIAIDLATQPAARVYVDRTTGSGVPVPGENRAAGRGSW